MAPGQCIHLCHSCIKISCSHGMSHRFRLLAYRCMLLRMAQEECEHAQLILCILQNCL